MSGPNDTITGLSTSTSTNSSGITTFGTSSSHELVACRVCGRTLLLGERSIGHFTADGDGPFDVCELCVPRAERFGLRGRPSTADEVSDAQRARAGAGILGRLRAIATGEPSTASPRASRRAPRRSSSPATPPVAAGSAAAAAAAVTGSSRRPRALRRRSSTTSAAALPLAAVPAGSAAIPLALAAFNASPHARTLAGLHRTLGAPRASVMPRSATDREVILTVAWEIVWYQFRIMPDGIEQERGTYLADLAPRWQQWNCEAAPDGTVREAGDWNAPDGQEDSRTASLEGTPDR